MAALRGCNAQAPSKAGAERKDGMIFLRYKLKIDGFTYEEKVDGWCNYNSAMSDLQEREKQGRIEIIGTFRESYHECGD